MSRRILGLEIREASIAAVLLDRGFKGCLPEAQAYFPIPADLGADAGIKTALAALVDQLKPAGAACVLSIPTTCFSFRNLSLPFNDIKKIRQILPFELEPTLPTPVEELIFDFEAVKRDGHQDLLAFMVQRSQIRRYIELLEAVSLRPVVIMPGGYAAARFIAASTDDREEFLLIDSGEGNHTIYVVISGNIRMVRTLPVAGGGSPVIRGLETALRRTLTGLQESLGIDVNPSTVFSTGPQSDLLAVGSGSPTVMGLPVQTLADMRTFPRLIKPPDTPDWKSGRLDNALALALMEAEAVGGVNFSSERSTVQYYWNEYRRSIILTAALILLTLTTALVSQALAVRGSSQRLTELDRQIETIFKTTFPEVTRVVNPLQQMQVRLRETGDGSNGLERTGPRPRVIDVLDSLSRQIPAAVDVQMSQMVVGADNVVLSGHTDSFNTVDDIKGRLEKADLFTSVTISSATLERTGNRVRFRMNLEF